MRSPPLGACWLTVSETPSHWGPMDAEVLTSGSNLGSREAEATTAGGLCYKKQERRRPPLKELALHPTCFNSEETEARSWKVTLRVMQTVHG